MTFATLMGTGTLYGREGYQARVRYVLENSPDLLSLGPCQQCGTLDFLQAGIAPVAERGPLPLDLEDGRRVYVTLEDATPMDAAGVRYAVWWW